MNSSRLNEFRIKKLPKVVRIEPSAACNLRCRHCPTGTNQIRINRRIMDMKTFDRIVEQSKKMGCVDVVVLYHGGEPFLNKNLLQMIKTFKDLGIRFVKTVTNGMLVTEADLDGIIDSGLDSIEFSLDGLSAEENNKIRVGSNYYKVIDIIKKLIILKQKKNNNYPEIFIANTQIPTEEVMRKNIPISPPDYIIKDLGDLKSAVGFKCYYMIKWSGFDLGNEYKLVESLQSSSNTSVNECDHVINTITIRFNGDVVPCCYDLSNQYVIGNILQQPIEEIWNNSKYLALRKSIHERNHLPLCKDCFVVRPQLHVCKLK